MTPAIPRPVLNLAREYRETEDRERRRRLRNEAYRERIHARITDVGVMVAMVRKAFEGSEA